MKKRYWLYLMLLFVGIAVIGTKDLWKPQPAVIENPRINKVENERNLVLNFSSRIQDPQSLTAQMQLRPDQPYSLNWIDRKTLQIQLARIPDQMVAVAFPDLGNYDWQFHTLKSEPQLVLQSPQKDQVITDQQMIHFVWDQSIFPLSSPDKSAAFLEQNLHIDPGMAGAWRMIGTTGFAFEPAEPWQKNTLYTVSGLEEVLGNDWQYQFQTERLVMQPPQSEYLVDREPLRLVFNQAVDLGQLESLQFEPRIRVGLRHAPQG